MNTKDTQIHMEILIEDYQKVLKKLELMEQIIRQNNKNQQILVQKSQDHINSNIDNLGSGLRHYLQSTSSPIMIDLNDIKLKTQLLETGIRKIESITLYLKILGIGITGWLIVWLLLNAR